MEITVDCYLLLGACGNHEGHKCGLAETEKRQPPGPSCDPSQLLVNR